MEKVLLVAGGGTLGTYVTDEMVSKGVHVDVICLEDYKSNDMVTYYKEKVTFEYINEFLRGKQYSAIVDFLHYVEINDYEKVYNLYCEHTKQIVLLSSYRVYADEEHPIVEESPTWFDIDVDKEFLETENYALPKLRCENFLKSRLEKNWTIVRPVISFSDKRFDLFMYSGSTIIDKINNGEKIILPKDAKDIVAGIDWAGNTGKLIGKLLMNEKAMGEAFTISSAPNITWGDFANIYHEVLGADIVWGSMDEFIKYGPDMRWNRWGLKYDRLLNRLVDASKVMSATDTKKGDFKPIKEALTYEFEKIKRRN